MADPTPIKQTIFEQGPQTSVGLGATPVVQYSENPTILPNPINPAVALDNGVNWYGLGREAFDIAGKLADTMLGYVVKKTDTDINDLIYDAQDKIFKSYSTADQNGFSETSQDLGKQIQDIEKDTQEKIADRFGAKNFFDESFTTDGFGARWFPVIESARRGMAELSANAQRVQRDALVTGIKQKNDNDDYVRYLANGYPITRDKLTAKTDVVVTSRGTFDVNKSIPPEVVDEFVTTYAERVVPRDGVGPVNEGVKEKVSSIIQPTTSNITSQQFKTAAAVYQKASPSQRAQFTRNESESLRLASIGVLLDNYSPDEAEKMWRMSNTQSFPYVFKMILDPENGKPDPLGRRNLNDATPDQEKKFQAIHDLYYETITKLSGEESFFNKIIKYGTPEYWSGGGDATKKVIPTQGEIDADPYADAALLTVTAMLLNDPTLDANKIMDGFVKSTVLSPSTYKDKAGKYVHVPYQAQVNQKTEVSLFQLNKTRQTASMKPISKEGLAARAAISLPLDASSIDVLSTQHTASMDKQLNLSRTVISPERFKELVGSIRNESVNKFGSHYASLTSEAQVLQYALATSDEVLKAVNGGKLPQTDKEITNAIVEALRAIPPADNWGIDINPENNKLVVSFTDIPFMSYNFNGTRTRENLLTKNTITPDSYIYNRQLQLRTADGSSPSLTLQHTLRDSNGSVDMLQEAKEIQNYLDLLMKGKSTDPLVFADINKKAQSNLLAPEKDLVESVDSYFNMSNIRIGNTDETLFRKSIAREAIENSELDIIDKRTNLETDIGQEALTELETDIKQKFLYKFPEVMDNTNSVLNTVNTVRNMINSDAGTFLTEYWSNHFGITTLQSKDILQTLQSSEFTNPYAENKKTDISQILFDRNKRQSAWTFIADMTLMVKDYLNQNLEGTLDYITQPSANTGTNLMTDSETASKFYRLPYNISDRSNPYKDYYKKPSTENGNGISGGTGLNLEKFRMGPEYDTPEQDLNSGLNSPSTFPDKNSFYFGDNTAEAGVNGEQDGTPPDNIKLPSKDENGTGAGGTIFNYNVKTEGMKTDDQINNPDHYRLDGSRKGSGWLGVFELPNGTIVSEYSISVELDGQEIEIPTLVPTLTLEERVLVLQSAQDGSKLTQAIYGKAVRHAMSQISNGNSPFAEGELNWKKYEKQQPSIPQETQPVTGDYIRPDRLPDGAEAAKILKQRNIEIQKRKDNISPGIIGDMKNTPDIELPLFDTPPITYKNGVVSSRTGLPKAFQDPDSLAWYLIPTTEKTLDDTDYYSRHKMFDFGKFSTKEKAESFAKELSEKEKEYVENFQSKLQEGFVSLITKYEPLEFKAFKKIPAKRTRDDSSTPKTISVEEQAALPWAIGYGLTSQNLKAPIKEYSTITKKEADAQLKDYVYDKIIPTLQESIPYWDKMNPNQQAALISFAKDVGPSFMTRIQDTEDFIYKWNRDARLKGDASDDVKRMVEASRIDPLNEIRDLLSKVKFPEKTRVKNNTFIAGDYDVLNTQESDRREALEELLMSDNWNKIPEALLNFTKLTHKNAISVGANLSLVERRKEEGELWSTSYKDKDILRSVKEKSTMIYALQEDKLKKDNETTRKGIFDINTMSEVVYKTSISGLLTKIYGKETSDKLIDEAKKNQTSDTTGLLASVILPNYNRKDDSIIVRHLIKDLKDQGITMPDVKANTLRFSTDEKGRPPEIIINPRHENDVDVFAHEGTHAIQPFKIKESMKVLNKEIFGKLRSKGKIQDYVFSEPELPAFMSSLKAQYFKDTQVVLKPSSNIDEVTKFLVWLNGIVNENKKLYIDPEQTIPFILLDAFQGKDPKVKEAMRSILKSVAFNPTNETSIDITRLA